MDTRPTTYFAAHVFDVPEWLPSLAAVLTLSPESVAVVQQRFAAFDALRAEHPGLESLAFNTLLPRFVRWSDVEELPWPGEGEPGDLDPPAQLPAGCLPPPDIEGGAEPPEGELRVRLECHRMHVDGKDVWFSCGVEDAPETLTTASLSRGLFFPEPLVRLAPVSAGEVAQIFSRQFYGLAVGQKLGLMAAYRLQDLLRKLCLYVWGDGPDSETNGADLVQFLTERLLAPFSPDAVQESVVDRHLDRAVYEDGEDGQVVASCPTLPGCISQGKTREQAKANLREAIEVSLPDEPAVTVTAWHTDSNPHPQHDPLLWRAAVRQGRTQLGYHDWVEAMQDQADGGSHV